jgi:hypothetical protein
MNRPAYKEFWPVAYIKVVKVYPSSTQEVACSLTSYPNCNTYNVYTSNIKDTTSTASFVALCRREKIEGVQTFCDLGKIIIGYKAT